MDKFTKSALEGVVRQISEATEPQWMYVEHDTTLPPIGRITTARLTQLEDGEYAVDGEMEVYDVETYTRLADSTLNIPGEEEGYPPPLAEEILAEGPCEIQVEYDPLNYDATEVAKFAKEAPPEVSVKTKEFMRKAAIPPSILVVLIATPISLFAAGFFGEMGKDAYQLLKRKLIALVKSRKPHDVPIVVFRLPLPEFDITVEGSVRSAEETVLNASIDLAQDLYTKATALLRINQHVGLTRITYALNLGSLQWEINYLITRDGDIILGPSYTGSKRKILSDWVNRIGTKDKN